MNKTLFKEGDLVYNLRKDGNIYTVINNYFSKIQKSKEEYPLGIQYSDGSYESFTIDGRHIDELIRLTNELKRITDEIVLRAEEYAKQQSPDGGMVDTSV